MKKLTTSILSLILCATPVAASAANTDCLSKDELINKIKSEINLNGICSSTGLSLKELLEKFGCGIEGGNGNIQLPLPDDDSSTEQAPEADKPVIPEEDNSTENIPEQDGSTENAPEEEKSFELQVLELINEERTSRGLSELSFSEELSSVARAHSSDMASRGYFSHNTPEGITPFDRIKNAGISYNTAGENIAAGQQTPEAVVDAWMNSDGHRANILNASYTETGIGCVYGGSYGIYWTQVFTG